MQARSNPHEPSCEPHRQSIEILFGQLASSREGLSQADALDRLEHEGLNVLAEVAGVSVGRRIATHLGHPFALLLWTGALLACIAERFSPGEGMRLIAAALVTVVLINGAFSFWQETRVERAMAAFRRMLSRRAHVLRDQVEVEVDAAGLVAGDVLVLREGDRVPADARLFEANALKVDNAPLTGECEPQLRTAALAAGSRLESRNLVFAGTLVTSGTGKALVYATGDLTEIGHIAGVTLKTVRIETPIRREIRHFVRVITCIALALGVGFFATGWALGNPFWTNLVFAIGIIVANVPEGLLPTVTLALAIAGRKMAKQNALLKTLESAETLGCTTVICTDKTGTITQNEMRVTDVFVSDYDDQPQAIADERELALRIMVLCNNARLDVSHAGTRALGDPTETALLLHAESVDRGSVARRRAEWPRVFERPFDSATREMATVHRAGDDLWALLKGAPEVVIAQCDHYHREGETVALTRAAAERIYARANSCARRGRRVLALARKRVDASADWDAAVTSAGYDFVGLVAMHDPPRPAVATAVARCRAAGIHVVVVSGDHPLTVQAIAHETGIVRSAAATVHTGADLAGWSKAALRRALANGAVLFARTSPLDKLRIVTALQENGHVVAVTGDGVNDAPAIKRADIGIAMGQTGTDVAREAADMVLMDDNFASIVSAVEEGRVVYGNIRRFVGYVLTSNVPEMLPYVAFVLLGIPLPITVLLILAVDLGTDMAPAIALANEVAETDVMQSPPRSRTDRLLSRRVLVSSYLVFGLVETAAGFAAYFWVLLGDGWTRGIALSTNDASYGRAIAAFFAAVVICQIANVLVWRTTNESVIKKGILKNRAVVFGVLIELVILVVVVQSELGHRVFGTAPLPPAAWLVPIPFALGMLAGSEALKLISRRSGRDLSTARLLADKPSVARRP
ncbi:MAG TPA: cation-transporting P-type ATPase [Polyangiales bacterium]|nr:cation-transporting P-type ATPase [Polyangiales bacterium]